jgi:membrane-bound metal-dependent hydrolase YbcI (DUF457 family)
MLALNHATLATSIALGLSLYYERPFFLPLLILVIFAGVFPDIDHPGSELGRYFKPIGKLLPHRGITHSILGTGIFVGFLYFLLGQNQYFTYFLIIAAIFGNYLFEKILAKHIGSIDEITRNIISEKQAMFILKLFTFCINLCLVILLFLVWNNQLRTDIFILLIIGYIAHIIGDFVTIEGVPLFYPIKMKFGLKLFRTGSWVESTIGFLLFGLNIYFLYLYNIKFDIGNVNYWLQYMKV